MYLVPCLSIRTLPRAAFSFVSAFLHLLISLLCCQNEASELPISFSNNSSNAIRKRRIRPTPREKKTTVQPVHHHHDPKEPEIKVRKLPTVIHACHTLPAAESEIPSLLLSRPVAPASDETFLTNTTSKATRVPKAIVIGKGFSDDEVEQLMRSVRKAVPGDVGDKVVWLTPDDAKFSFAQKAKALASAGTLLPRVISDRVKVCLKEGGLVKGKEDSVQGGHWGF